MKRLRGRVLAGLILATVPSWSPAASWEVKPFLEISGTYADNLYLQPAGQTKSDFVTQINPGVSLVGEGPRLDLRFDYRLQNLLYASSEKLNSSYQQILGAFDSELMKDLLYFDGDAAYRQMVVDPERDIGQGNISINTFRQNIATSRLTPYLKRRLGGWAESELRYSREAVRFLDGNSTTYTEDSVSDIVSGNLADARTADRWGWRLGFYSRKVKYTPGLRPRETWQNVRSSLDYLVGRKLSLNGTLGYEKNEYQRGGGVPALSGAFWTVGFDWRPSPRTSFRLSRGERYFGPVWNLELSHRGRRTEASASYIHDLNTRARTLVSVPVYDSNGNPVINPNTSEQLIGRIPVNEVFIRQLGQLNLEFRTRKSRSRVGIYREIRDYQQSGRQEDINGAFLAWRWSLTRRGSLNLESRFTLMDVAVLNAYTDDMITSSVSYRKELGQKSTATVEYERTRRARSNTTDYSENLLAVRLIISL